MSESRYERITQANVDNENNEPNLDINSNDNIRDDTAIEMPNQSILHGFAQTAISTLGLILIYFTLSIGLTFYQRNFLKVRRTRFCRHDKEIVSFCASRSVNYTFFLWCKHYKDKGPIFKKKGNFIFHLFTWRNLNLKYNVLFAGYLFFLNFTVTDLHLTMS